MKKLSLIILALLLCVALVACGGGGDDTTNGGIDTPNGGDDTTDPSVVVTDPDHVHVNKTLAAVASTCTEAGLTDGLVCTDCGKTLVAQVAAPLLPHKFVNGKCSVCGNAAKDSEGLSFTLSDSGEYSVSGIGSCADTQIVIPSTYEGKPVTNIAASAFANNEDIVQVVIPSSVKSIGHSAFERCVNLADISFSEGLESIGIKSFMYCTSLKQVIIPDSVTEMQTGAFMACYNLVEVTLGSSLKTISNDTFFECYNLEVIDIMSKISEIGGWAFYDCDKLTTITFVGSDTEWNALKLGNYWDENSGTYSVSCSNGKNVHKHVYGDWYDTGKNCESARICTKCSFINYKYTHDTTNAKWEFTSEGVITRCAKCNEIAGGYMKNEVVFQLDFDRDVADQAAEYPYFRVVGNGSTIQLVKDGDRTAGLITDVTWFDYDKQAFTGLSYYSITFDMMVSDADAHARDNSVVSFVPGYNNGTKVGTSVGWNWQIKYVPVLGKIATKALNGTDIPYKTYADVPQNVLDGFTDANSFDLKEGQWVTIDVVCDVAAKKSYVFADGKAIGTVNNVDYTNANFGDAFSLRFCDVPDFRTMLDNFKIQAMTLN